MAVPADPTSVMGRRIGAVLIDAALVLGPPVALVTSNLEFIEEDDLPGRLDATDFCDEYLDTYEEHLCVALPDGRAYFGETTTGPFLTLWGAAIVMYVVLQGLTGWTVGKLIAGIRVVREDGGRPGILRALVRWLLWLVDGLPFVIPGVVAFITGLTTTGHRRVGDMVAKTYVVHAKAAGRPVTLPGIPAAPAPPTGGLYIPPPPTATPGPQWDAARGTYIQWDPEATAWMQWDDDARRWDRLPGQDTPPPPPPPPPPAPPPPPPPA